MTLIRDIIRGSQNMPHVGPHPGTPMLIFLGIITMISGWNSRGVIGLALGLSLSFIAFGGMFAIGAVSRARLSDRLEMKAGGVTTSGDLVGGRVVDADEGRMSAGCVIEIRDGEVIVNGQPHASGPLKGVAEIRITKGTPVSLHTDLSVVCDDVNGSVNAGANVNCGNVGGSLSAGGNVNCDDVGGSVTSGGRVNSN